MKVAPPLGEPGEQLTRKKRREYLGGSDVAAVLGVSPWSTPLELFLEKISTDTEPRALDAEREKVLQRGQILEPYIVDMTMAKCRDMGLRVELVSRNWRHVDREFGFLRAEIDFELRVWGRVLINGTEVLLDGEVINADAKSVSRFVREHWGEEHTEEVPVHYAAQFMHGLMVTGRRYCLVGALMSLDDVQLNWIVRDDETIAAMRTKLVAFWDLVQRRVPPDPINFADVKLLFPQADTSGLQADDELREWIELLRVAKGEKKLAEEHEEQAAFEVARRMGVRQAVLDGGTVLATFKTHSDGNRVLRLPEPRKTKR